MSLTLAEIPAVLKAEGMTNMLPNAVTCEGRKTGAFPVIEPKSPRAAGALSGVVGYEVPLGDGVRFATQRQAADIARALLRLGVHLDELVMEWQLGKPQGPATNQESKPSTNHGQPSYEDQLLDSPF